MYSFTNKQNVDLIHYTIIYNHIVIVISLLLYRDIYNILYMHRTLY